MSAARLALIEEEKGSLLESKDSKKTNCYDVCFIYFKFGRVKCAV